MSDERVSIEVVRSGGFGGVRRTARADTDDLDEERAAALRSLVADAALGDRGTGARSGGGGADRFQYDVTLVRGNDRRELTLSESGLSEAQQRLVHWVLGASRRGG
jgi:hypothetical protein